MFLDRVIPRFPRRQWYAYRITTGFSLKDRDGTGYNPPTSLNDRDGTGYTVTKTVKDRDGTSYVVS